MAYSRQNSRSGRNQKLRAIRRNRFWLLLYLWIAAALPELVLHFATAKNFGTVFNGGLFLAPLFALVSAVAVFILCTAIPNPKVCNGIALGYSGVVLFLCGAQLVYYRIFGTFFSVYSMTKGGAAMQFGATIFSGIMGSLPLLLLMALPLVFLIFLGKKYFTFRALPNWKMQIPMVVFCVALHLLIVLALPVFGGFSDTSPYGLYHKSADSYAGVNKLGLLTAFRLDLQRTITDEDTSGSIVLDNPIHTDPPAPSDPIPSGDPAPEGTNPDGSTPDVTLPLWMQRIPNQLDIDFTALAESEDNSAIAQVHQYFATRVPSLKNKKTGMFEGCNLIMITAEAFSNLSVDPQRTPTLYKLLNEGFVFTNYYVPDWGVSTTDGEYAHLTGTIPKSGEWSFERSAKNHMPLTMSQQLLKLGYSAYAYHGHTYDYYNRDKYLANLGFDYKGLGNGLNVTKQWPESDVEVVDQSTGDYVNDTPFVTYYMSISGHREFTFSGNMVSYRNKAIVADLPYSDMVRAYLSCQYELEKSLTLLLERLEAAGVLDNTVIVLTADHYPNGLTPEQLGELLGHTPETNFEIFKNGLVIWKQGMESEVIDDPVSHLDILPTLSNLFGLEFDSRLYMGRDVFSDETPLVMFRNRSWITDRAMYNADTGEITNLTDTEVNKRYIQSITNEVSNRFTVSARILEYDYWSILFD